MRILKLILDKKKRFIHLNDVFLPAKYNIFCEYEIDQLINAIHMFNHYNL
jgi:hypothetical protein